MRDHGALPAARARFHARLVCPECGTRVTAGQHFLRCAGCGRDYPYVGGVPAMVRREGPAWNAHESSLLSGVQAWVKRYPGLYYRLVDLLTPILPTGDRSRSLVDGLPEDALVLNLGSGPLRIAPHVINVDVFPFNTVDLVADIGDLPFPDDSVDGIVCKAALEHVLDPGRVVAEIHRVLRPGGRVFVIVPFIVGFHASPSDYHRWTLRGVEDGLMGPFRKVESGLRGGPTSGLSWVLQEWLSLACSLGWDPLYQVLRCVFLVGLFPLKYLDFVLARHPRAAHITSGVYFIGEKRREVPR